MKEILYYKIFECKPLHLIVIVGYLVPNPITYSDRIRYPFVSSVFELLLVVGLCY